MNLNISKFMIKMKIARKRISKKPKSAGALRKTQTMKET